MLSVFCSCSKLYVKIVHDPFLLHLLTPNLRISENIVMALDEGYLAGEQQRRE